MHPILIGTIVWLLITLVVGYFVLQYVGKVSPIGKEWQNQKIGLVTIIMSALSMWAMWSTCYLHQMYPLIQPKIEF